MFRNAARVVVVQREGLVHGAAVFVGDFACALYVWNSYGLI
ncbi:MAG: hypothetical protein ACTHN5_18120 [Phycisphaerae bacterium]